MLKKLVRRGEVRKGFNPKPKDVEEPEMETPDVEADLLKDGIIPFDNSDIMDDYLKLPADITEELSKELGKYFSSFTKQKMWVRTLIGRVKALKRQTDSELDVLRLAVYNSLPSKMSVTEKEIHLKNDSKKAQQLIRTMQYLTDKKDMLENYIDNLIDGITMISREISRRTGDWENEEREHNIGNIKRNRR